MYFKIWPPRQAGKLPKKNISGEGSHWYEWSVNTSKSLQTIPFTDNSLCIGPACFAAALFCETLSGVNMN